MKAITTFAKYTSCLLFLPSLSFAGDYNIPVNETVNLGSVNGGQTVGFPVRLDNSYCCQIWSVNPGNDFPLWILKTEVLGGYATASTPHGYSSPAVSTIRRDARMCFHVGTITTPPQGDAPSMGRFTIGSNFDNSGSGDAYVRCDETTLFGGFNTIATDFNFVEITNTLKGDWQRNSMFVVLIAKGKISGKEIQRPFYIRPDERIDLDLHSLFGKDFGTVSVFHNGPKGSLRVTTTQYKIRSQNPLDFEPVGAIEFRERE